TLPVELSSFTANITNQNYVSLNWITQSETGVVGFSIYRSQEDNLESAALISPMITATNTSQMQSYVYVDEEIFEDGTYYYWLENADLDGTRDYHGPTTIQYTSMNNNGTPSMIPVTGINSVYPNPFNPSTCIKYGLKDSGKVDITIYNSRGQKIRNLLSQTMDAGVYRLFWNGLDDTNQICTSGVYIVRMTTPTRSYSSRIILLK
ncbi:MAG TPA: T9SS type A sorting domain-containing protein, partial [Candidatus Cloacimonadota bacterium]|nr:T9SS type A sorting domain-containing protein [Candidatus Cloacimonadota bacterium]